MGPAGYGSYAYAMAWIALMSIATGLGTPVSSVRFVSQYLASGEFALLRGAIWRFRQIVLVAGSAVAVLGSMTALALASAPPWVLVAAWLVPLASFVNLNTEIARGLGRPGLSQVPDKVLRPLATLGGAAWWVGATGALTVTQAITAGVGAAGAVALFQLGALSRVVPRIESAAREYRTREWLRVALPLLAVSLFVLLLGQIDLLVAGFLLEPADVGIYSAAIRVASLVGFVPLSVTIVTSPQIAALHARGDTAGLQDLASHIARLSFWPSLLLAGLILMAAQPVLALFGPEFVEARWALYILTATQLFKAGMGAVGYFLDMTGHQDYNARAFAVTSAFGLLLNVFAIPRFGIIGAAGANFLSWMLVMLWLHGEVRRRVGVRASIVAAFRPQTPRSRR
jgi:O-antigen/teichoic acid export membrane protein